VHSPAAKSNFPQNYPRATHYVRTPSFFSFPSASPSSNPHACTGHSRSRQGGDVLGSWQRSQCPSPVASPAASLSILTARALGARVRVWLSSWRWRCLLQQRPSQTSPVATLPRRRQTSPSKGDSLRPHPSPPLCWCFLFWPNRTRYNSPSSFLKFSISFWLVLVLVPPVLAQFRSQFP
jgi:hypothetical protein